MKAKPDNTTWYNLAMELRTAICELFGAQPPERVILSPGILIGLQILFANLDLRCIALTTEEYYTEKHFPALAVERFSIESFIGQVERTKPDAVLASVVTWRGRCLPIKELFGDIKRVLGDKAPILIADYSHAGAVGFPALGELGADIVCGDPAKWVLPYESMRRLGFLWFRGGATFEVAQKAFNPFFLATAELEGQCYARWVDCQDVQVAVSIIKDRGIDREMLLQRHCDNLALAAKLCAQLQIEWPLESSIIFLDNERVSDRLPAWLIESGLVWNPVLGGTRILCRAETRDDKP